MAFNNVTFFELHLDDARFGGIGGRDGSDDEEYEGESEAEYEIEYEGDEEYGSEESRRGVGVGRAVVVLGIFVASAVLARRFAGRRGDGEDHDVEMHLDEDAEATAEPVEVVD